jgi:Flp pilus assembly protein TadG
MVCCKFVSLLARFKSDERGNIALMMGLLAVPLVGAVGYGLDYARAVNYKSSLNSAASAATLAAIDTARAMILADANATTSAVTTAASARALQVFNGQAPTSSDVNYSAPTIVTRRVGNTLTANIAYTATMTTTLSQIIGVSTMSVNGGNESIGNLTDGTTSNPDVIVDDNFDKLIQHHGTYVNYNNWKTTGSGVEISIPNTYQAPVPPNGSTYVAELDSNANTSISKKVYLGAGNYQLRYYYYGRVSYTTYDPAWLCSAKTEDVDWANSPSDVLGSLQWGYQTNRIGVYMTAALNDTSPALYTPASHNMIDVCVITGGKWIERNINIAVTTPGFYWLAFQAEGVSDSRGGLLSGIRLCKNTCAGTPQDNFPWVANQLLFSDSFETPDGTSNPIWYDRTLDASGTNSGWPRLPAGWTTSPENQVDFQGWAKKTGQYGAELDGSRTVGTSLDTNRAISRKFILSPGYYNLNYYHISVRTSAPLALCGVSNINSNLALVQGYNISDTTRSWYAANSMQLGVYMDPDLSYSHPESTTTLRAIATWKNPDGSAETLPRLPANMIDACVAAPTMTQRSINLKITKPGFYWLTLQAEGDADQQGAAVDDVTLTALGGLSMSAPPAGAVSVKAAGLAFGSTILLNGLQITAQ